MDGRPHGWPWFRNHADLDSYELLVRPVWIFDVDRHEMWWGNGAALGFWNAESQEAFQARDFSTDSSNVRDRLRQIVSNKASGARVQESWTLYPSGQPTTIIANIAPVWIADGRRAIMLEVSYPLDLGQDPEALRLLEAAKNTPLMISTYALGGNLLAQNTAAAQCYGAEQSGLVGQGSLLKARIGDVEVAGILLTAAREDREHQRDIVVNTLLGTRWHRVTAKRGRDPITGQVVLVLSEEDISDHVQLKTSLAEAKERLEERVAERTKSLTAANRSLEAEVEERKRTAAALELRDIWLTTILENAPLEVVLRDRGGKELLASNRRWTLVSQDVENRKTLNSDMTRVLEVGEPIQREISAKTTSGPKTLIVARFPLTDPLGETHGTCSITTDITEQRQYQVGLARAQKMEAVGRLTGGIAHDFNNLLAVIQGNAELLAEEGGHDQSLIQPILHASGRGAELTHSLLAFARKQALRPEVVDLVVLVERTVELLSRTLGPSIRIVRKTSGDQVCALADPGQIELALLNLALNARDAMPGEGTLTIDCRTAPSTASKIEGKPKPLALLEVTDTGCGMSPETRRRAFEPFYTTKDTGQGSGLGLAMVYGFAKQSGGKVTCLSREGEGTVMSLYLPLVSEEAEEERKPKATPLATGQGETVLLLEDDEDLRQLTSRTLIDLGYRVLSASQAAEARAVLSESESIDLLLTDVLLPGGVSGLAFAKEAIGGHPDLKVVVMSGNIVDQSDLGSVTPLLRKPFRRRELAETLRHCLDQPITT